MGYKIVSVLASVLALSTWTYYFPKDKPTDQRKVNFLLQSQSQGKTEKWGMKFKEQQKVVDEKLKEDVQKEPLINFSRPNQIEDLLFTSTVTSLSGSFPLGAVFMLLLIHTCGADLVAAVYSVTLRLFSIDVFIDLMFGMTTVYYMYKWKREREELVKTNSELQRKLMLREQDYRDENAALVEVKTKLKSWMDHIRTIAEEVEAEREENIQKLQSMEKETTEKVTTANKSEYLLVRKEDFIQVETGPT